MVMYAKIRRMFYREHLSISEVQRRTGLSRNTIKKWLKAPGAGIAKYQRAKATGKLTPFEPGLLLVEIKGSASLIFHHGKIINSCSSRSVVAFLENQAG